MGRAVVTACLVLCSLSAMAADPRGLYLMTRMMGGSLQINAWYFSEGRFAQDPRDASTPFDFEAAEKGAPGTTGRLSRAGGTESAYTTFPWEPGADPAQPGRLYLGGFMLKRTGG